MGSKEALSLAKNVSEENFIGPEPVFGLSATVIRNTINDWVVEAHNRYWLSLKSCRWARLMVPHINKELSEFLLSCNRNHCRLLIGVLSGHNTCASHLYKIGHSCSQICSSCGENVDSTEHYLCSCPAFCRIRFAIFGNDVIGTDSLGSLAIKSILHFIKKSEKFT